MKKKDALFKSKVPYLLSEIAEYFSLDTNQAFIQLDYLRRSCCDLQPHNVVEVGNDFYLSAYAMGILIGMHDRSIEALIDMMAFIASKSGGIIPEADLDSMKEIARIYEKLLRNKATNEKQYQFDLDDILLRQSPSKMMN